jgi:hypothetical protein
LDLRCGVCGALFRWDYFGSQLVNMISLGDPNGLSASPVRTDD